MSLIDRVNSFRYRRTSKRLERSERYLERSRQEERKQIDALLALKNRTPHQEWMVQEYFEHEQWLKDLRENPEAARAKLEAIRSRRKPHTLTDFLILIPKAMGSLVVLIIAPPFVYLFFGLLRIWGFFSRIFSHWANERSYRKLVASLELPRLIAKLEKEEAQRKALEAKKNKPRG